MKNNQQIKQFHKILFSWYKENGRHDLPWRHTDDLYHITVSEIMLQQTNVPKVIEKYAAFLKRFPTWQKLARAQQSSVLQQWQGLGYNRRALNLHKMAKIIITEHNGYIPRDPDILETIPGIGPYTCNAILVFGCNFDLIARDVNIDRVIRRWHGKKQWSKKSSEKKTVTFLPHGQARDFHGALMDFASLICTKRKPLCEECPFSKQCHSYPDPHDYVNRKKKEPGRVEQGRHIPRRIYRGRIIEFLRGCEADTNMIGRSIKKDWDGRKDKKWITDILLQLQKEEMLICKNGVWQLK